MLVERLLERVQRRAVRERLDRLDLVAVDLHGERQARAGRPAVDQHRARAADAVLAADVRPVEARGRGGGSRRAAGAARRARSWRTPLTVTAISITRPALSTAPSPPRACSRRARTGRRPDRARRRPRAPASRATPPTATRSPFRATQTTAKSPCRCACSTNAVSPGGRRETHLDEQLAGLERGREDRDEELLGRDRPPVGDAAPPRARARRPAARRSGRRGRASRRPSRGSASPCGRRSRAPRGGAGSASGECSRSHWRVIAPTTSAPSSTRIPASPSIPREVDERRRPGEPEVEHRHEALAAGERLRVLVRGEQRERLVERRRPVVRERRGLHCVGRAPRAGPASAAGATASARAAGARRRPRSRPPRGRSRRSTRRSPSRRPA